VRSVAATAHESPRPQMESCGSCLVMVSASSIRVTLPSTNCRRRRTSKQIIADGKTYPASSHLRLPPLIRDLTIDYTALSLVVPEKVRFRIKLEGQDRDWREFVNVRQVQYSNLAPGSYRFRVTACNNSGVWNEQGASLDFSIAPAYWQTRWFVALCVVALMALLWALYQLRLRQLARQFQHDAGCGALAKGPASHASCTIRCCRVFTAFAAFPGCL